MIRICHDEADVDMRSISIFLLFFVVHFLLKGVLHPFLFVQVEYGYFGSTGAFVADWST